jgi:flagellar biosynthesis/type III secretory pathway protein FliH
MTQVLKAREVAGARDHAQQRGAAERLAQQELASAVAAAHAAGVEDGRRAAEQAAAGAATRAASALERLVALAEQSRAQAVDATSRAVLASAVDIAEWVLRHELSHSSRSLLDRLAASAQALLPSAASTLVVSPTDEAAVGEWAAQQHVEVAVDPSLAPGDARFDSGAGTVDVTVAAALRIAAEALGVDPARLQP